MNKVVGVVTEVEQEVGVSVGSGEMWEVAAGS